MIVAQQGEKKIYSDGAETEQKMLQIAQQFPEDQAEDFIADDSTYTINNTFSSVRRNILNWYPFKEHADILEIGAGMGAVTGLLCDVAESVVAIEMSKARAEVIKARYPSRDHLTVLSENINSWDTDKRFDYAVFVGVLEYAAVFSDTSDPYVEFLNNVKKFLKPDGRILFAIENRFGLKYWLGGSEDHLQEPFAGIRGYENNKGPRTFSRKELEEILFSVGLTHFRFYSVLPDYKFPELIFSDEYKPNSMNLKKVSFTYSKNSALLADEKGLYKDIIENDVFPFFANSFLVEASACGLEDTHPVLISAKGEVYKEYRVSTVMDNRGKAYKIPMHRAAAAHISSIIRNREELSKRGVHILPVRWENGRLVSDSVDGPSAQDIFSIALKKNDRGTVELLLDKLNESLTKSSELVDYNINNILALNNIAKPEVDYGTILQKAFIDMTFYNAFWVNNELVFYDQEWCFERVPLKFCLYYSLKSAYNRSDVRTAIGFEELTEYLKIAPSEFDAYEKLEELIWSRVLYRQTDFYGADGYCNRYNVEMTLAARMQHLKDTALRQQKENTKLSEQNESLKAQSIEHLEENIKLTKENMALKEINVMELETNAKLKCEAEEMEAENVKLRDSEKQCRAIAAEANRAAEELQQTIRNKEGHIELLLETEREYEREKNSRTYRLALVFRKISIFFLPVNSKRRFLAKMFVKGIRHPKLMLHMINPRRIRNFFSISKKEGMDSVNEHYRLVEEYENSMLYPFQTDKLEVSTIEETADKTIQDYTRLSFAVHNQPQVSIVVPVYNQFEYTYNCLESILKNSGEILYEVIIADDCSADLTKNLEKVIEGIKVIHNEKNLRFLLNCNNAAQHAAGEYIVFLNNDTQVQAGWLDSLVSAMERDSQIGMTGSKLLYSDGHLQEAGGIIWKDASAWNYENRRNPNDSEFNYVHETDYISGAAIMIRTSLWKEIGGFDERYVPAYCEDSDLAFEVRRHGYKVVYQPKSEVVHFEGVSNGADITSGQKKYQIENQKKFYEKWKSELEENHFDNGTNVFLARDRSRGQKHVLVIDHYVPQYDKDAGSKTTFMYLKMLVQKGFQITFLGDNFYQHEPYTTELQQMGILVLYGPKYAENWKEWLEENISCFDVFYLNRPHISIKYIDFIKERAKGKIIYYGHDLHFLRIRREYEVRKEPELLKEAEKWREQELYIMGKADMSYYPSSLEIEEIHNIDPAIPAKVINAYIYEQFPALQYKAGNRIGLLFVGSFGHDPNLDAVLWFVNSIYPEVYIKTGAPFYIVGSNVPETITKLAGDGVVVKGFVTEEELVQLYASCRMAVIPLRYGAGVKGKVVEALYYGMPIVTTSVGAEGIDKIEDIAVVRDTETDLADAIISAYTDYRELEEKSRQSRQFIEKRFNVEAAWAIVGRDFQGE